MSVKLRIAIDGGAATGKSTVAKLVSKKLDIRYINTGQMYRLFAFIAIKNNILNNEHELFKLIKDIKISYDKNGDIQTDFIDFSLDELESPEIGKAASMVSSLSRVREIATNLQKKIGCENGILLEGRDIGTIIMPNADFKFFLTVKPKAAAKRRFLQIKDNDSKMSEEEIYNLIVERNERDKERKIAPLIPAIDALEIDTSDNSAEEIADKIVRFIHG